jgi:RNA polymerase sigma-70 factor, ECF subfamily
VSVAVLSPAGTARTAASDLANLDESTLVERAKSGDREAFGELFRRHQDTVLRVVRRRLRAYPSDVDDVTSEVFLRAFNLIGTYEQRGRPFAVWLKEIARWRTVSHRSWREHRREDGLAATEGSDIARVLAERSLNPEDAVILRLELQRMLRSLPARRRLALVLRDWAGWSYDDIGRALKLSEAATDRLVNRARKAARSMAKEAA